MAEPAGVFKYVSRTVFSPEWPNGAPQQRFEPSTQPVTFSRITRVPRVLRGLILILDIDVGPGVTVVIHSTGMISASGMLAL